MQLCTDILQGGNKGWEAGRHIHKVASHHMPVLPCHTLQRNFKNRARFLGSCGGTEWRVSKRAQQHDRLRNIQLQLQQTPYRTKMRHADAPHMFTYYVLINHIHNSKQIYDIKSENEVSYKVALIDYVRWHKHTDKDTAACTCVLDWCLTPVKAQICSNVWAWNGGLSLWSEGASDARLVLRDSQASTHMSGVKRDFKVQWERGK